MIAFVTWLFLLFTLPGSICLRYPQLLHTAMLYWLFSWIGQTFALPLAIATTVLISLQLTFSPIDKLLLGINTVNLVLFIRFHLLAYKSGKALFSTVVGEVQAAQLNVPKTMGLLPMRTQIKGVKRINNIAYGEHGKRNLLDIFIPEQTPNKPLPIVIQIHGGAWITGNKEGQGQPIMNHMANNGWMGVAINYRLAPKDRFPAMLSDIFEAIAWLKQNASQYGGDPSFIALTGGSAGGHLSALATLCFKHPRFTDSLTDKNIHVNAAVPLYGRYDFLDPEHYMGRGYNGIIKFMSDKVMQPVADGDTSELEQASPVNHLHEDSPPMLVIHGTHDSLLPYEEARDFVKTADDKGMKQIQFHLLTGAQHSFDIFNTPATYYLVNTIEAYLNQQLASHQQTVASRSSL